MVRDDDEGMALQRVLLTGMSGTGKSTLIAELAARGYQAIDTDSDDWCEWVYPAHDDSASGLPAGPDWIWREDRMMELLSTEEAGALFVSGCKSNQGRFYPYFDHIVLLSAPAQVIVDRVMARTNNPYGKDPDELAEILGYLETVEPLLRRGATLEIDTTAPVEQIIETLVNLLRPEPTT